MAFYLYPDKLLSKNSHKLIFQVRAHQTIFLIIFSLDLPFDEAWDTKLPYIFPASFDTHNGVIMH